MTDNSPISSLLQYLPAIYQDDPFIGQFLLAFEKILVGRSDDVAFPAVARDKARFPEKGLEEKIAALATYFDPQQTPEEFLPWLASWTAFTLRADLPVQKQRDFIANIIQLYRRRGTRQNLQDLLSIFTKGQPTVIETPPAGFQIGVRSTVGDKTILLGGERPHYFHVKIALSRMPKKARERQEQIARALIDLEKPAHTDYELSFDSPSIRIGVHSTVGVDTLLGNRQEE